MMNFPGNKRDPPGTKHTVNVPPPESEFEQNKMGKKCILVGFTNVSNLQT